MGSPGSSARSRGTCYNLIMVKIDPVAIYDVTMEFVDEKTSRNWHRRLRYAGFKRSACGEAYFHPDHWENAPMSFGPGDPGDTWIMDDAFKAKTPEAKAYLAHLCE